ncbi:MAG: hypothetical protein AOA65_0760 [Candidatus Bathyarchaeota archaeon BA1]|nr:MAG: hypothetical protein AOA65_0760 [Candidatus Bathyarchaeota archaeon BA1]
MAKLFFLLSGEHPTLPFSELRAILEAEGHEHRVLEKLIQVLRLEANPHSIKSVAYRSAMTRVCGIELSNCKAMVTEIMQRMYSASLEGLIEQVKALSFGCEG